MVRTIPGAVPFQAFSQDEPLFQQERLGNSFERLLVELGMIRSGSREGGFFIVIGKRRADA